MTVVARQPGLAEPRQRPVRLPRRGGRGHACCSTAARRASAEAARARRTAGRRSTRSSITHWHLDHWGDLVPWVWGRMFGLGREARHARALAAAGRDRAAPAVRRRASAAETMFEDVFELCEYAEREPFRTPPGSERDARQGPALHGRARSRSGSRTAGRRSLTRATPLRASSSSRSRATPISSSARRRCRPEADSAPRGHLSADEAIAAFEAVGAKRLLLTHRPDELPGSTTRRRDGRDARASWSSSSEDRASRARRPRPRGARRTSRPSSRTPARRRRSAASGSGRRPRRPPSARRAPPRPRRSRAARAAPERARPACARAPGRCGGSRSARSSSSS